ncbi:YDG domain-containing protein, partial [Acinetobacter modestus]
MNKVYRTVWNKSLGCWQVTSELTRSHSRGGQSSTVTGHVKETKTWFQTLRLSLLSLALLPISLWAGVSDIQLPTGGNVTVGSAQVSQNNNTLNVHQNSQNVGIQWDSFNIGQNATVNFYQPNTSSIAVNRVLDSNASQIIGKLNANGQVFLLNPNGVIFSKTAQVNVGGIVASTLNVTDSDIISGKFKLQNQGNAASIENYGSVIANGGVVAFIAPTVINEGQIQAHNGVIHLTAADQVTLKLQDGQLTEYKVEIGTLQGLIDNRGAILANNGAIYLTAKAKDSLSQAVVNHSGIIEANRLSQNAKGEIVLLADMQQGTTNVSGVLKSEGRNGQAGGFIETSAAQVKIADSTHVSTLSDGGKTGTWLIDPTDFSINAGSAVQTGSGIGATTLQNNLNSTSVILETQNAGSEKGDINVNAAVTWNKDTTLTLKAHNDINVNASITAQNQDGKVALLYGQNGKESANYYIKNGAQINLKAGQNFSTQKGTDVSKRIDYKVVTDLQALQNINSALAGNYVLGTDIDATVTKDWGVGAEKGFNPLGNEFDYFTGRFDGLGHTVSHLTINRPYSYDVGLFGHIDGAVVRNVGLVGGSVIGDSFVGGLVGQSTHQSLVENVFNTGSVQGYGTIGGLVGGNFDGSTIKNAYATGNVTGAQNSTYIGGLVGGNDGAVIENVYASGNVNGTDIVGGLVGDNNHGGTINNAYATGTVTGEQNVGGLVGNNYYDAEVKNAYATGAVTGNDRVGGLVGENLAANIENTYALGKVTGVTAIGGLLGKNVQGVVTNSYWDKNKTGLDSSSGSANTSGLTSDEMFNANKFVGFDFDKIWANADNQTTPYFKDHIGPNQVVNKQDQLGGYYSVIQNLNQLQNINQNLAGNYLLGNDIDAKNSQFWGDANGIGFNPLGDSSHAFTGKLDGLGHQISDLYIYRETTDNVGLFGYIQNANLKNFGVVNSNIKGQNHVGAVVGNSTQNSQLYSIYSTGSVVGTGDAVGGLVGQQQDGSKIESAYSTSQVTGQNHVGGLVGTNQNAIIKNTYATGAVSGLSNVAGLVGSNQNQATIQNAYATGRVTGNSLVGGLVGNNNNATVSNGHWNKETTLQNDSAGSSASFGLTNAEMKDASKFSFLDADSKLGGKQTAWRIYDGLSVPLLRSFLTTKDLSVTDKTTTYTGKEQHFADVWGLDSSKYTANGQTSGTDAGLYKAIYYSDNQHGYDFIGNEGTLTINKAKVTVTGNSDSTIYNGKTQSVNNPHYTVDGLVNGEAESLLGNIAITGASGKDAGTYTNKVTGENSSTKNYDIAYVDGKFVINKKKATVYALDETREYNGFNQQINSFRADGLVDGETESVLAVNAVATRKDAGNYVHAVAYSNAAKGDKNYDLNFVNGTYTITKATATIKGNSLATTYNGQIQNVAGFTISGLKGNDVNNQANIFSSVNASGASDRNAGSYTNTVAGAASTTNYNIVYENGSLNIAKKQITGVLTAQDKVYDGTTNAIVNGSLNASDVIAGDQVSVGTTGQFVDKNAGQNKVVTASSSLVGLDAGNYELSTSGQVTANISKKQITGSITAQDKVYDGTTNAIVNGSLNGLITGDQVNLNAQGQFADKNAGSNKNVNVSGNLSGTDAGNYDLAANTSTQANISKKQITGSITAQDKVYDGTTSAIVNGSLNGLITGDQVNLNAQGQFADKNAGSNKNVNVSGNLSGTDAGNYSLQVNSQTQANISKKQITGSITAQDKVYDGTTSAIVNGSLNASDVIAGDQVSVATTGQFVDKNAGQNKVVTASSSLVGLDAGNYSLQVNSQSQANISKKQITGVLTAQDKVYDGTTGAIVNGSLNGLITGDQVNLNAQGQFADKNAGSNKNVNVSGSLSGTDAGNYSLQANSQTQASISKKQITGVLTAQDKVYDGTTNAIVNGSLNGLITGDQVNLNAQGQFADKNAGSNKNVNVSGNLTGTDAGNYSLQANSQTQANISKKQITGSITAQDKVYDGTTSAIVNGSLNGLITGDQVNLNAQGQFVDKNAGQNKVVTASSSLVGLDASNYELTTNGQVKANISKKQITASITAQDKVYDGTTSAIVNGSLNGLITGDQVNLNAQGQFADKNAGSNKNVNVSGNLTGTDAGNYSLQANSQTQASISKKQITGVLTAQDKVYDGTTSAIVNGSLNASDVIAGDQVSVGATGQFVDKNAGQNKVVTASSSLVGLDAGNYELTTNGQVTANISKKQITGSITAQDKVYDGTTSAIVNGSLNGLITGDQVNLNAQGQFADKNASANKTVNVSGNLTGTDAANYDLAANSQIQANISKKQITGSITAQDKVYDGTTNAIVNGSLNGLITGDQVNLNAQGQFADKNAGSNKNVNVSGNLSGTDAGNYDLAANTSTQANISKKQITGSITAQDKVYDGTTSAIVNGSLNGLITGDQVNLNAQGQFADKNAGSNKNVNVSGNLSGTDAGNYSLQANSQTQASISKKQITGVLTVQDKVYDGTTSAIVNGSLNASDVIAGDQVSVGTTGQFVDKNAGQNKVVTASSSLVGLDAGNYELTTNGQVTANISKKQITGVLTAQDKVYDGTTNAIVNGSLNGLITGDEVNLNAQGQFADKNAGSNKNVNVSGSLSGTDAGNYSLQANSQTQASISKKQITGVLTAQDKVYDGTTNAIVSGSLNGLITGDQVNLNAQGQFADKNAGSNKNVNVSGNLSGTDAGNYSLQANSQTQASISKKQITGVLTVQDKVYDGTTSAIVNGSLNASDVIAGDQVSVGTTGQFVDKNAGQNKVVTASSSLVGLDAGNYELTTNGQVTANISKKQITGVLTAQDKVYDGTTNAIVNGSLNGLITGDEVNLNAQGQFADKNAGSNKNVNVSGSLSGTDAGNYDLAANTSAQANISKKQITGSITAQDKVYDGTTSAIVNGSLNGLITGDQVNLNAQGQFADKNAGSNKTVNVSGNLSGTDAANYSLQANSQTQANISKKQITGSITAQDKVYDGTTSAIVNGSLNGLITGDQVNLNAQGQFADKNAGSNKNVNVSGNLSGTDAGNYDLAANTSTQANISKKQITGSITAQDKVYDGTTSAIVNGSLNGLITGDQVNLNAQGQFADKNAGSNKNVNVSGNLSGTDAVNYSLQANSQTQASISKKQITGVLTAQDKVYDGTTSAIVNGSLNGLITGDQVNLNAQGQFADKNAGSNKNVNVSG